MTIQEKALKIIHAENDEELYEAVRQLTDKQKDCMIVSLIKIMKQYELKELFSGKGIDSIILPD